MIDFSGYTKAEIEREMLKQVDDDLDKREGSVTQTAIGPAAWLAEGFYMDLDKVQKNGFAETAQGSALDLVVAQRGVTRKAATAAKRKGYFNIPVSRGAEFKTINGADSLIFTAGDLLSESEGSYTYEMTCKEAGSKGNAYSGNVLPITAVAGLTSAIIGEIIEAGTDEETDEALRARYDATFDAYAFGGNIAAYRTAILAMGGVGAVQVYPAYRGGGTVLCSILGDDLKPALDAVVNNVQTAICPPEDGSTTPSPKGYGMAVIGAEVTITTATSLPLDISCDIEFAAGIVDGETLYKAKIEERLKAYIDDVCKTWGDAIKTNKISYAVEVYIARLIYAILEVPEVVNVTNVTLNGKTEDLALTETADLQQIPELGAVTINGK